MSNLVKYVIPGVFILIAVLWILVWAGVIPGLNQDGSNIVGLKGELIVWGIDDDPKIFEALSSAFKNTNPGVKIKYEKKSKESYEQELIRAFAAGNGPDVFGIHHTWLGKYSDILFPAPAGTFSSIDFNNSFLDVVRYDFVRGPNIYGVPLYVDTMALYYNIDLFNSSGIVLPPKDWDEFLEMSKSLTRRKPNGGITISGAALGGAQSVLHSPDILALLMMQYGAPMVGANGLVDLKGKSVGKQGSSSEKALEFYTSFAKQSSPNYSWIENASASSENAFAQNSAAMMLGYTSSGKNILAKSSSRVNFGIAEMPQIKNAVFHQNYADYWGWGVYKNSKNKDLSWQFLKFLTRPEINRYYLSITKRPASQKSLILEQQKDPAMKVFADQALTATSWIQWDKDIIDKVFLEMIENHISTDQQASQIILEGEKKINALLRGAK